MLTSAFHGCLYLINFPVGDYSLREVTCTAVDFTKLDSSPAFFDNSIDRGGRYFVTLDAENFWPLETAIQENMLE